MASCSVWVLCFIFVRMQLLSEGATQSLSSSFDSLSANATQLFNYGQMGTCYVAYLVQESGNDYSAGILFIPTPSNSSFILSIVLYTEDLPAGAVIWMANRNNPVSGNFSLVLDQTSGNLLLFNGNGALAWSSNTTRNPAGGVSMDLITEANNTLPVGTLRLFDDHDDKTLWQSSDHPTHALMSKQYLQPGMRLTSWASLSDPSQGPYNLVMEPGGIALYYNAFEGDSQPYWVWSTNPFRRNLSSVTHTCNNLTMAFMDPSDYFVLEATNEIAQPNLTSAELCLSNFGQIPQLQFSEGDDNGTFLTLQYDGNVVATTLSGYAENFSIYDLFRDLFGENRCRLPNYCGPYGVCTPPSNCECPLSSNGSFPSAFPSMNPSQGCPPAHNLTCSQNQTILQSSQSQQRFVTLIGVDNFSNDYSATQNFSTQDTCKAACLRNCSCVAAFWREHTSSCFHVDGHMGSLLNAGIGSYLAFLKVEAVPESKPSPAAGSASPSSGPVVVAGVVSGAVGLLICLCMLAAFMYRRSRKLRADPESEELQEDPFWNSQPGLPTRYSYKDLHSITNGFTEKMGKGGFGTVYAGVLRDGSRVAVKRLEGSRQGKKEFKAEVVILGGIHHYNLVGLVGFCAEGSHRLLVYEYMAKGSLDQWLFTTETTPPLHWEYRFNIALGAARGLAYLHHHCKEKIIHLDIKPQNILLDDDFAAKVSDFGLSTLMSRDQSHVITTMRGTPGYLAPEWLTEGSAISEKCDVFSFGKLLMEILGGRRNLEPSLAETEKFYFPAWLYDQMTQGTDAELAHLVRVETPEEIRQASLLMNTAFLCVLDDPHMRPSMETVVHMLEGHLPEVEHLQVSNYSQGLHFALRMTQPKIEEACAPINPSVLGTSQGGEMSFHISAR